MNSRISFDDFDLDKFNTGVHSIRLLAQQQIDGSYIELPAAILKGNSGHVTTIISGQHGNEWNGAYICQLVYENLEPSQLNGTIVLLPIANPVAFQQGTRVAYPDGIDMNRVWGLSRRRKSTEHLTELIFNKIILKSDYVLDLHTGGPGEYLPCVGVADDKWLDLAGSLNLKYIFKSEDKSTLVSAKSNVSMVFACKEKNIPVMLCEIGHGSSIDKHLCAQFFDGIRNFLVSTNTLSGSFTKNENFRLLSKKVTLSSPSAGYYESELELGASINSGESIGGVTAMLSKDKRIINSPNDGLLIYLRKKPFVAQGETLAILAI